VSAQVKAKPIEKVRTRLTPEHRRAQLVGIGLQMLTEQQVAEPNIDQVAAAAGVSRGLIFHYFPTTRDYHLAVIEAAAKRVLKLFDVAPEGATEQHLREELTAYLEFVERRRDPYVMLARGPAGSNPDVVAIYERARGVVVDRIIASLGRNADNAKIRLLVGGWLSFVEDVAVGWATDKPMPRDELVEVLLHTLLAALGHAGTGLSLPSPDR